MLIGLCFQLISSGTKCDHRQRRASQKLQLNDTISSNVNWKVQKVKKSVQSLLSPLSFNAPFVTFITGPMCSRESARPRTRLAGDRGRTPAGRTRCLVSPLPWHDIGDGGGEGWWSRSCFSLSHWTCPRPVCPEAVLWETPMQSGTVERAKTEAPLT